MSLFSLVKQSKQFWCQSSRMLSTYTSCLSSKSKNHMKDSVMYNYSIYLNFGDLVPDAHREPDAHRDQKIAKISVKFVEEDIERDCEMFKRSTNNSGDVMFKNIKEAPVTHYTYN